MAQKVFTYFVRTFNIAIHGESIYLRIIVIFIISVYNKIIKIN